MINNMVFDTENTKYLQNYLRQGGNMCKIYLYVTELFWGDVKNWPAQWGWGRKQVNFHLGWVLKF